MSSAGRRWGRFHPGAVPQVEAIDARTGQTVRLRPGDADRWRQHARAGQLLCPVRRPDGRPCGLAYETTVSGGGLRRDHFRHAGVSGVRHAGQADETVWHVLAKRALEEWAYRHYPGAQVEVEGDLLPVGEHGRQPDVRIVRTGMPIVAVEVCWSSPATGADWLQRHQDYQAAGVSDAWLLTDVGPQGRIRSTPARTRGGTRLRVTPTPLAAEMIRHGVVPLWLHLPCDGPDGDAQVARVATPLAFRKVGPDRRTILVTPTARDIRPGWPVLLDEASLDECSLADPPRSGLLTPLRRRQLAGDIHLRRHRASPVAVPGPSTHAVRPERTIAEEQGTAQATMVTAPAGDPPRPAQPDQTAAAPARAPGPGPAAEGGAVPGVPREVTLDVPAAAESRVGPPPVPDWAATRTEAGKPGGRWWARLRRRIRRR